MPSVITIKVPEPPLSTFPMKREESKQPAEAFKWRIEQVDINQLKKTLLGMTANIKSSDVFMEMLSWWSFNALDKSLRYNEGNRYLFERLVEKAEKDNGVIFSGRHYLTLAYALKSTEGKCTENVSLLLHAAFRKACQNYGLATLEELKSFYIEQKDYSNAAQVEAVLKYIEARARL